jgi:hypothetical protein
VGKFNLLMGVRTSLRTGVKPLTYNAIASLPKHLEDVHRFGDGVVVQFDVAAALRRHVAR